MGDRILMNLACVEINPNVVQLNFPLRQIFVGVGSFLNVAVTGIDTARFTAAAVIGQVGPEAEPLRFDFGVSGDSKRFEQRIPGYAFLSAGNVAYEIQLFDSEDSGAVFWAGRGLLTVRPMMISGATSTPPPKLPIVFSIQDPDTLLWHKVVGAKNSDGELTMEIEKEGIPYG